MSILVALDPSPDAGRANAGLLGTHIRYDSASELILPDGTYVIDGRVAGYHGARIRAGGKTTLVAGPNVTTAMFCGLAGTAVKGMHFEGFTVDCAGMNVAGFQFTNGADTCIRHVEVRDAGRNGIAFMSHPGFQADHVTLLRTGLAGNTGSHAFLASDSPRGTINHPEIHGGHAMGVATVGDCSGLHIFGGRYSTVMDDAGVGLECIGISSGSDFVHVLHATVLDSQDNGISASGDYGLYQGCTVQRAVNSCIGVQGNFNRILQNTLMNGSQESPRKTAYAGIMFTGSYQASYNLAEDNLIVDNQATPTLTLAVRESKYGTAQLHGDFNTVRSTATRLPIALVGAGSVEEGTLPIPV